MPHSRRLIVGSAGSGIAFGTIQSLRDHYGESVFVIAIDSNRRELVAASLLADAFVQMPLARAPEFPAALHDLAALYPDSCYLPIHDQEIDVAARIAAEGRLPRGLKLIAPPYEVVRLCSDKWEMHRWLMAKGLPSPKTAFATPEALEKMPRPAILKPREGTAAVGVRAIHDPAELKDLDPSHWLLQETLQAPEAGTNAFLSRCTGAFYSICREILEKRANVTTKMRVFDDRRLAHVAERLARELPLFGSFNIDVMMDTAGRWQVMDVNPRSGAATRMHAAVGMDFAAANLADFWGEPTDSMFQRFGGDCYVVRQYADYVTHRSIAE